ncbi:MAG TPA: ATP-binding protein [Mycobacteriales bacterium]|nr:ATP-binding protein [Mycobacteriales bacterium]
MRQAERVFPPDASSVRSARRFSAEVLASWSATDFEWVAGLVLSELATNAVLHASTPFTVTLILSDGSLRLEVRDGSSRRPGVRNYGPDATTGRGLALVRDVSRAWGTHRDAGGKVVWSELVSHDVATDDVEVADVETLLAAFEDGGRPAPGGPRASAA